MDSDRARSILGGAMRRAGDRRRGYGSVGRRMSGFRALELTVADVTKLPANYTTTVLQTTTGAFIYLTDYSTLGGGDVLG